MSIEQCDKIKIKLVMRPWRLEALHKGASKAKKALNYPETNKKPYYFYIKGFHYPFDKYDIFYIMQNIYDHI